MNKQDLRSPSEIQDLTYQQNRDSEFEFNAKNFNKIVHEILTLRRQRTEDLTEILQLTKQSNEHRDTIIRLHGELNHDNDVSILKLVV